MNFDNQLEQVQDDHAVSRRGFAALTVAAGVAGVGGAAEAEVQIVETDVVIKTVDGACDAALFHPAGKGSWPAVVMMPDALGLRPVFRGMGRRLASAGYAVLVPNPFYRTRKAPVLEGSFDFTNPADRAKLGELRAPMTPDAIARDASAWIGFLDGQKVVNTKAKAGTVGYCMGGPMTVQASAALPMRVGASASFHGGGLVTDKPDSPHLLIPKLKARYYVGVADNDDKKEPLTKTALKDAFVAAKVPAKIEVYEGAMHGWCVPGSPVYNQPAAERAWGELLALYKAALV